MATSLTPRIDECPSHPKGSLSKRTDNVGWDPYPRHFLSGVKASTRRLIITFYRLYQVIGLEGTKRRCVCTMVDVNRISWNIKMWNWIVKHVGMRLQLVPSILGNAITTLLAMNDSKIKWPMNECVGMSQVEVFPIRKKTITGSVGFRGIRRLNVMSMSRRCWANNVVATVILKPEPLVDSVVPRIRWMGNIKIHLVAPINKTGRLE
jgi:hypothetical protein